MAASAISILVLGITAAATITQYRATTAGGAVAPVGGNALGFSMTDAATGDRVPVAAGGTAVATAGGAIALGAAVEVGATGKVVTRSAGVTVGRALTAAAADGDQIEVLVIPN